MYTVLLTINLSTIFLSLTLLFFQRKKIFTVFFLSSFLILLTFIVIVRSIIFYDNPDWLVAIVFTNFTPFYYLVGPFIYFHIRSYLAGKYKFQNLDLIHFIPSILQLINVFPYIISPFAYKLGIANNMQNNILIIRNIEINTVFPYELTGFFPPMFILGYGLYCIYILVTNFALGFEQKVKKLRFNSISHGWLIYLCIVMILISSANLILTYNLGIIADQTQIKPFVLIQSILLVSIPVSLILTPQVLYGVPVSKKRNNNFKTNEVFNSLSADQGVEKDSIMNRIHDVMDREKPFLARDFSFEDLVSILELPKNQVYLCLNEVMNMKFTDLRSHYRVEHAKKLLLDIEKRNITIEAIGIESGFPTRSSFYRAFKAETGITPMEFVEGKIPDFES
jgi:AraC-like DNA-binding protein